jgi:flavocytochrome c
MKSTKVGSLLAIAAVSSLVVTSIQRAEPATDVLVVGAGISGLSAALEAARGGAKVKVVDMWSVFGGHAVMSQGAVSIVGTAVQAACGIKDSPALAYQDFIAWGEDADAGWVRYYVDHSREEIYDWLEPMGVQFDAVTRPAGNSVPRFHIARGRGVGLVAPIFRECAKHPAISFAWNIKVDDVIVERGRVIGVRGEDLRRRQRVEFRARGVIMATGGFQSNLEMVRSFWPKRLPFPARMLVGSGVNSTGSGHEVATKAGGLLFNMDHQWNYASGLPDPRDPGGRRGLSATNSASIWVNSAGKRFVDETAGTKVTFPALLRQQPATYWAIFDEGSKRNFAVSGSDWGDFKAVEEAIFGSDAVKSASTIEDLARNASLPAAALAETVRTYNEMIDLGHDREFGRFGPGRDARKITRPPFYAVQFFPLTRKSLGGVSIDHSAHVLDREDRPIPGLYAVGELTGFGGINGKAGLEGTFLGPSIVTGRVAGRTVLVDLGIPPSVSQHAPTKRSPAQERSVPGPTGAGPSCAQCHDISALVATPRRGYAHFEKVHRRVAERTYDCLRCHAELSPYRAETHRIDRVTQSNNCAFCHVTTE